MKSFAATLVLFAASAQSAELSADSYSSGRYLGYAPTQKLSYGRSSSYGSYGLGYNQKQGSIYGNSVSGSRYGSSYSSPLTSNAVYNDYIGSSGFDIKPTYGSYGQGYGYS